MSPIIVSPWAGAVGPAAAPVSYTHLDCPSGKQKKLYFTDKSREYMTDLLEYCKAQGVEKVLFARFPHAVSYTHLLDMHVHLRPF